MFLFSPCDNGALPISTTVNTANMYICSYTDVLSSLTPAIIEASGIESECLILLSTTDTKGILYSLSSTWSISAYGASDFMFASTTGNQTIGGSGSAIVFGLGDTFSSGTSITKESDNSTFTLSDAGLYKFFCSIGQTTGTVIPMRFRNVTKALFFGTYVQPVLGTTVNGSISAMGYIQITETTQVNISHITGATNLNVSNGFIQIDKVS
jgi:hypothetical protein